jgi:cytidine deaminase
MIPPLPARYKTLLAAARKARRRAYAPYSKFRVGAAALWASGKVTTGCNVENASYGLTCCAERTAIFSAVAAGERRLKAVAVALDAPEAGAPCGACRQVIYEFGPDADVILGTLRGSARVMSARHILPLAFGPRNLKGKR